MAAHAMCKASYQGIAFATVELNDIRHVFAVAIPQCGCTLREQAEDALHSLDVVLRVEDTRRSIIQQTVFLAEPSQIDECRQIIRDFYGADLPATSYILQPPCGGKLLSIEVHGVGCGRSEIKIERVSEQLVFLRHDGITWAYCTPVVPRTLTTPKACITSKIPHPLLRSFPDLDRRHVRKYGEHTAPNLSLLHGGGVRFDQVIRTWLYLGGIVAPEGAHTAVQGAQPRRPTSRGHTVSGPLLAGAGRGPIFPASTGIGTEGRQLAQRALPWRPIAATSSPGR